MILTTNSPLFMLLLHLSFFPLVCLYVIACEAAARWTACRCFLKNKLDVLAFFLYFNFFLSNFLNAFPANQVASWGGNKQTFVPLKTIFMFLNKYNEIGNNLSIKHFVVNNVTVLGIFFF